MEVYWQESSFSFKSSISSAKFGRIALAQEENQSQTSSQKIQAEDGAEQMTKPCVIPREVQCKLVKRQQQVDMCQRYTLNCLHWCCKY